LANRLTCPMQAETKMPNNNFFVSAMVKSASRLTTAISLLGLEQLKSILSSDPFPRCSAPDAAPPGSPAPRLARTQVAASVNIPATSRSQEQDTAAWITGETFSGCFRPRNVLRRILTAVRHTLELVKKIFPEGNIFGQELQNKLEAFWLFEFVDVVLHLGPDGPLPLPRLAIEACKLGAYSSVWATEGLGHYVAHRHLAQGGLPQGLLTQSDPIAIPRASLIPLNAGTGLALAESLLEIADRERQMDWTVLTKFRELCLSHLSPYNENIGFEALGLIAQILHPHLISAIDRTLYRHRPELLGYFWHGVGRAIYFSPTQTLLTYAGKWRGLDVCLQEPPHKVGQGNAVAGFAWALTLVNIRQPAIVAAFLGRFSERVPMPEAFINGVCSALVAWREMQPGERHLEAFLEYQPDRSDRRLCELWKMHVQQPSSRVLQTQGCSAQEQGMERLFRYQPLDRSRSMAWQQTGKAM